MDFPGGKPTGATPAGPRAPFCAAVETGLVGRDAHPGIRTSLFSSDNFLVNINDHRTAPPPLLLFLNIARAFSVIYFAFRV